jgi:hypothetical protein
MEQLVIGKYPADSFCLWDGDELIARTALYIFESPEDMLLQLKIALIAYKRGNHLPYLYVNTGIKLLLKHIKLNISINNRKHNLYSDLHLITRVYKFDLTYNTFNLDCKNHNIGTNVYKFFVPVIPVIHHPSGGYKMRSSSAQGPTIINIIFEEDYDYY